MIVPHQRSLHWLRVFPCSTFRASPCLHLGVSSRILTPTWQQLQQQLPPQPSQPPAHPVRSPGTPSSAHPGHGSASTPTSSQCLCLKARACSPPACREASTQAQSPPNRAAGKPAQHQSTTAITRQEAQVGGLRLPKPPWRTQWTSCRASRDWLAAWRAKGNPPQIQTVPSD